MPKFQYGSVAIQARNVTVEDLPRSSTPQREGFASRNDRLDVRSFAIESLHAGLGVHVGTGAETDAYRYKESQGLWAHQLNKLVMPPALTANSALAAVNASGYRDANKGVVTARSSLGGSTPLNYYGVGPYLIREDTSGVTSIAHTFTDNITWIGEVTAASTRYFGVTTDGTTNDAVVTTDPTAVSISFSTWFTYASGDRIDWFWSMREVGNGFTVMAGKLGSRTGFFYLAHSAALATAPTSGVGTATRDTEGDLDVASVTAVPATIVQVGVDGGVGNHRWEDAASARDANAADVAAADGSAYANANGSVAVGDVSTILRGLGFDFSTIWDAPSNLIKGIEYKPTIKEGLSTYNIYDWAVNVYTLAQQSYSPNLGLIEAGGSANEWPGAMTQRTYGGPTMLHGRTWTPDDLRVLQVDHSVEFTAVASASAQIDHMPVTVYYQQPGTQQAFGLGSELIGHDPVVAGRLWVIEPEGDDATGRVIPRRLVRVDVDYDPGGMRPSFEVTPQSNLPCFPYVLSGAIGEQALFLALGNNKDLAKHFIRIPFNNLVPEDVEWSRDQGFTEDWGINALYAIGNDCILQCATVGATVMQDMIYESHSDAVHFYGPRHTITALPLRMKGQGRTSAASRRRHGFYTVSTTHLASIAQYTPDTPHLDPFATLSAVTKQDGPLHITMAELPIMGPPEGRNALLTARCGSRQVSATKTIALYYSLDGGSSFTLWTTFTAYGGTSTLSPAVSASTVVLRIELDNPAASADTPGGLPLYVFGDSDFNPRRRYTVVLDEVWLHSERGGAGGVEELWDTLSALTPHLQDVTLDNASQGKFKWNRFRSGLIPGETTSRPVATNANPAEQSHVLVFDEVAV